MKRLLTLVALLVLPPSCASTPKTSEEPSRLRRLSMREIGNVAFGLVGASVPQDRYLEET
jgi:hypothetical protein